MYVEGSAHASGQVESSLSVDCPLLRRLAIDFVISTMFLFNLTSCHLRLAALMFASPLLVACTEAPEGIHTADDSTVHWTTPDTVAVLVPGEPTPKDVRWRSPDSAQKAWLAEHGFDRIDTRYSEAKTKELWLNRLRTLRGLIGQEHIPEARQSVVRELAIEAVGSDEYLGLDISDGFDTDRFQKRLGEKLGLRGATREEVQAKIDTFEASLEDYKEERVFGRAYYAQNE